METFITALASILIGVTATIWVSNHYFRRSTKKSLTPYIQFSTSVFRGVEPSLRESLKINYRDVPITDLFEVQFLIANTGHRPIRDLISPLTLKAPGDCEILDASLLHVNPQARDVRIEASEKNVVFNFPLLNSDEFFITKLLLKGEPKSSEFEFRIAVDDLPPVLPARYLPSDLIDTGEPREFERGLFGVGLVILAIASAFAGLIYGHWSVVETLWIDGLRTALQEHWLILGSVIIALIPTIILLVIAPMMLIGAFTNFSFPKRRRFRVPSDYLRFPRYTGSVPPEVMTAPHRMG